MLEVKHITKSFGGINAVAECSLKVTRGSITGLIGPNGAGKTTLFNLITGHYKPDNGRILFQGRRIDGLRPDQVFKKKFIAPFKSRVNFPR